VTLPALVIPADIRFPLERASGIQIVKTAAALARGGAAITLIVRRSDPRPTEEILGLYGVEASSGLEVQRLRVFHRRGSFAIPRASFLLRAAALSMARGAKGAYVFTRDLQLADLLLGLGLPGLVYEAHAVESSMYAERGRLYGTSETFDPAKKERIGRREGRVWRRAAGIVTTTAGIRDTFTELYGPRGHASVIPNGCDVSRSRDFPGLPEGRRVLYTGQLYPWKGVDVLVEAMAALPDARLVILGGIEAEADLGRIRSLVASKGLAVEMPGTVSQARVAEELQKASVVVAPFLETAMTERHTSPLKAFEALAAGRPLVASDLPSSREFLRNGENALLVPPGDPRALAEALRRVLSNKELALRLARTAYAEAPQYSWDRRAEKIRDLLAALGEEVEKK
jgi:glycosyltransferase involved in cell wall biosynthesis